VIVSVQEGRIRDACWRLSKYGLHKVVAEHGPLTELEASVIRRRVLVPRVFVLLIRRLAKRGYFLVDERGARVL
jgi:hypothetical protein